MDGSLLFVVPHRNPEPLIEKPNTPNPKPQRQHFVRCDPVAGNVSQVPGGSEHFCNGSGLYGRQGSEFAEFREFEIEVGRGIVV